MEKDLKLEPTIALPEPQKESLDHALKKGEPSPVKEPKRI